MNGGSRTTSLTVKRSEIAKRDPERLSRREKRLRARLARGVVLVACQCASRCGLSFPPRPGRRTHPQCPSRDRSRRTDGRPLVDHGLLTGAPKPLRCPECEDMPHRRRVPRCRICDGLYEPEAIDPVEVSLRSSLGWL